MVAHYKVQVRGVPALGGVLGVFEVSLDECLVSCLILDAAYSTSRHYHRKQNYKQTA